MRFALSVLGPALFSALPLLGGATALALAPATPAFAQAPDEDPNLDELEEQVLRQQIEQYLNEFGKLAHTNNTMIIPSNLSDVAGTVAAVAKVFSTVSESVPPTPAIKK